MNYALVNEEGRVVNIVDVPDGMVVVERGRFFEPPAGTRAVEATAGAEIGGTYTDDTFGPTPASLEDKVDAMLRDVAKISPNGEAAAIIAAERQG